jgi:hypothetical protein
MQFLHRLGISFYSGYSGYSGEATPQAPEYDFRAKSALPHASVDTSQQAHALRDRNS